MGVFNNYQARFNENKYWNRRNYVQRTGGGLLSKLYLIWLRRIENALNASTGLGLGTKDFLMCHIDGKLNLYHRLNGIIIARNCRIGSNVTIFHNVTIAESNKHLVTIIDDDVTIGTGAVILNNVHIGRGAKIGANAVVTKDIPDGVTAVGIPAKVLQKTLKSNE